MLSGRFVDGKPVVAAKVLTSIAPPQGSRLRDIEFGLDFTVDRTTVTTGDLQVDEIPLDDLPGDQIGLLVRGTLSFRDSESGPTLYTRPVLLRNGPAGDSAVGLDILRSWLVVIDIAEEVIHVQAREDDAGFQ